MGSEPRRERRHREAPIAVTAFALVVLVSAAAGAWLTLRDAPLQAPAAEVIDNQDDGAAGSAAPDRTAADELQEGAAPRALERTQPDEAVPEAPEPAAAVASAPAALTLVPAEPASIAIPSLGVDAAVMRLGLNDDGTMQVPPHAPREESQAGWYRHSPTPGTLGPSVIVGHVDSDRHGPSVFYGLDRLDGGDTIEVTRDDGSTAIFAVERTEQYGKDEFPTDEVYGNIDHAGLRLITCGGEFDTDRLEYTDNVVVYGRLVDGQTGG